MTMIIPIAMAGVCAAMTFLLFKWPLTAAFIVGASFGIAVFVLIVGSM